jgi:hypothetical protein
MSLRYFCTKQHLFRGPNVQVSPTRLWWKAILYIKKSIYIFSPNMQGRIQRGYLHPPARGSNISSHVYLYNCIIDSFIKWFLLINTVEVYCCLNYFVRILVHFASISRCMLVAWYALHALKYPWWKSATLYNVSLALTCLSAHYRVRLL